ncbi:MAG: hypothetical protein RIC85_00735 [Gammaproteobacteria bacterium]
MSRRTLEAEGCLVIGPVADLAKALRLARSVQLDGAILDINLRGTSCFPVATELARRGVPYLFLTGYDNSRIIPPEHRNAERLAKPVDPAGLASAVREFFKAPFVH